MKQQTTQADVNSNILVQSVAGDLRVAGWERSEIMAKTNGDVLDIQVEIPKHHIGGSMIGINLGYIDQVYNIPVWAEMRLIRRRLIAV